VSTIEIIRHAPKNDLEPHGAGGAEALLSKEAPESIRNYVNTKVKKISKNNKIILVESPVTRSAQTASIMQMEFLSNGFAVSRVKDPRISSYDYGIKGEAVNLRNPKMSKMWADGKQKAQQMGSQTTAENESMRNWAQIGMSDRIGNGATHLEIASRMAQFLLDNLDNNGYTIAISHSGDIEFLLYALLMKSEYDGFDSENPTVFFDKTGGALKPLEGLTFTKKDNDLEFSYNTREGIETIKIPSRDLRELASISTKSY
jgi:hypothetical protein